MALPERVRASLPTVAAWALGVGGTLLVVGTLATAGRVGGADAPHLVSTEIRLAQLVLDGEAGRALSLWWALLAPQPPIGTLPGWILAVLTGGHPVFVHLCMVLVLLVACDGLLRLSTRLVGGPLAGAAAFLAFLSSPFTWASVEQYSRDLVCAAAVVQAVAWAVGAVGLTERRAAIGFGVWMGVAFGAKYTAPMFLLGPCVVLGVGILRRRSRAELRGLGLAVACFAGVAGVWYATHLRGVQGYLFTSMDPVAMADRTSSLRSPDTLAARVYYAATAWEALGAAGVALVAVGALLGLGRSGERRGIFLVLAGAIVGGVILSRLPQQVDRYVLPGVLLATALVIPLARWPLGWALVAIVVTPRLVASQQRFAAGQPGAAATYEHPVSVLREAHWPLPRGSWYPSDFSPKGWNLDAVVAAAREAQGDEGTVGLLLPPGPLWPNFGHLAIPAAAQGARWDWATVNLRGGGPMSPPYLMGPLFDGTWPSSAFTTLIAFEAPNADPAVASWLSGRRLSMLARVDTGHGATAVIYRVGAAGGGTP